jgi:3-hydroxyisobutyrate dehydrogenase-like beta-hydroxyacid dehydrogenase
MKIGFIGVGNIGAPIAGQLLKAGHTLVVHDIRPRPRTHSLRRREEWVELGEYGKV